jgi:16S rRNA (guanine527-N7)-methyltransferase
MAASPVLRATHDYHDPRARRARFLQQVRIELALPNVEVVQARIEHWHPEMLPDTIVCQAVGSLAMILSLTAAISWGQSRI